MKDSVKKITIFYCINCFSETACLMNRDDVELKFVKMPCSSMTKDIFILKAYEAGADAVVVLTCKKGQCRYTQGNIRALKRVEYVKNILQEIGINQKTLLFYHTDADDPGIGGRIINDAALSLET